jgi:hypothetical protein
VARWSILTGYGERFDHNVFVSQQKTGEPWPYEGPFEYIDNDRSQWDRVATADLHGIQPKHHLRDACVFPKTLANRLLVLWQNQTEHFGLGQLMYQAMHIYQAAGLEQNGPFFTEHMAMVVNQNLDFIIKIIRQCIDAKGADRVLIQEPWQDYFSTQETYGSLIINFEKQLQQQYQQPAQQH